MDALEDNDVKGLASLTAGLRTGRITAIDEDGVLEVDFDGNRYPGLKARHLGSLSYELLRSAWQNEADVLIGFERNDLRQPVVMDVIREQVQPELAAQSLDEIDDVCIQGKRIRFDACEQITFKCGKASITLTRAGKVMVRGAYVSSRSSGVNTLKGGSVRIN